MSDTSRRKTLLLLTVDTEASLSGAPAGARPPGEGGTRAGARRIPPEVRVYGRVGGGTYGIERMMDCCEQRGFRATFFVNTLEALHYGEDHMRAVCSAVLGRGHDAQLHVHPIWLGGPYAHKTLPSYGYGEQRAAIDKAREIFLRACAAEPLAHRAGGLAANGDTLRALESLGIRLDSSLAAGYLDYDLGDGRKVANVPRRLGSIVEVPVTAFAQARLGGWAPMRNFDINADSLSELKLVVDRAASERIAAVTLLMHSFSFIGGNREGTEFWPAEGELRKFERFLDHVAARGDLEVVTFRELAARLDAAPGLLDGPDFDPTTGLLQTYRRSWERFGTGWKSKAFALGLPAVMAGLAALLLGMLWWLAS